MELMQKLVAAHIGYTYRASLKQSRSPSSTKGNTAIVQMADTHQECICRPDLFARANIANLHPKYLLTEGDIVLRSRGLENNAFLIRKPPSRMICIAPLIYLRALDRSKLLPAYLHWYVNLPSTQRVMATLAKVSKHSTRIVQLLDVGCITMYFPPLTSQQKIGELFNLHLENQELGAQMAIRRTTNLQNALLHIAALQESECSL